MSEGVLVHRPRPPPLLRTARALRRVSVVVLVVILLFVAFEVYSAAQVVRSKPGTGGFSAAFAPNDTIAVTGSFSIGNPGALPISSFTLGLRVLSNSSVFLGQTTAGPLTLAAGGQATFPVAIYLPVSGEGAAYSLLTENQYLHVYVWANATYGYLFPVSLAVEDNKSWGAPFSFYQVSVGPANPNGSVPVTVSFQNNANFEEDGSIAFAIVASAGPTCGSSAFPVTVPGGQSYSETRPVAIRAGCSLAGATLDSTYESGPTTIPLPPETLP
jgi:hypothetical protein